MSELYRINKSTLEELADTVRTATGQTGPISFDQIEAVAKESIVVSNGGTSGGGGSGSGVETCTVVVKFSDTDDTGSPIVVYYDSSLTIKTASDWEITYDGLLEYNYEMTLTDVAKNHLLYFEWGGGALWEGEAEYITDACWIINGDCTIG